MKRMKDRQWTFLYAEGHSLLLNGAFFSALTNFPDVPGNFRTLLYVNRKGYQNCSVPRTELQRVRREGKNFFRVAFRLEFQRRIEACADACREHWLTTRKRDVGALSDAELLSIFSRYVMNLEKICAHYKVSGGMCFPEVEGYVKRVMGKYFSGSTLEKYYGLVLSSTEVDILEREEITLRRLTALGRVTYGQLLEHSRTYAFHYLSTYDERQIVAALRVRIAHLRNDGVSAKDYQRRLSRRKATLKKQQQRIFRMMVRESKALSLIEFLRDQGRIRFDYKEWFMGAEYKFLPLFREISKRIGISLEEYMLSYRIEDTKSFLLRHQQVPEREQKARMRLFVYYYDRGRKHFVSGNKAETLSTALLRTKEKSEVILRGVTANSGRVQARARVILPKSFLHLQQEMARFQSGEVLITTMTQPSLMPIMKKASAIVTNQGGITSHAAVISRELNIPCVVGTYRATEVIQTGDLVEVDAERGVIKKLKT